MSDTIFALATPAGQSAIAIFRLSGSSCHQLAEKLSGKNPSHRHVMPVTLTDEAGICLDEAMMLYLQSPQSPTGEDVIEIHCHGSLSVITAISAYLARQEGVRPAEAGEFTKRAFDNGKMDLTEVEGLADLIAAQTEAQRRQALGQLKGTMRKQATSWRQEIISLSGRLESLIDFSDEDLPQSVIAEISDKRQALLTSFETALDDEGRGEIIRNGVHVVLLGPVNAGKSTALNALAGRPAAIVSDEAGTTRDIVEVRLDLGGIAVILQDTAGLREEAGMVESIGIARARRAAAEADLVILMADGSRERGLADAEDIAKEIQVPVIKIANKADIATHSFDKSEYLPLSLHQADDIAQLESLLADHCKPLNISQDAPIITRERHRHLLQKARQALEASLLQSVEEAPELVAEELRIAADALGQMTGHIDVEDILSDIFSSFCIGK